MLLIPVLAALNWGIPNHREGLDDAFITYRYAQNLAAGNGFVFNPGDEAVQGTSTPLYTFLLTPASAAGLDLPVVSQVLGTISTAVAGVLMVFIGVKSGYPLAGAAAGLIWSGNPYTSAYFSGMETPLYVALMLGAFLAAISGRMTIALTLAGLVALTRIDGLAVVATISAYHVIEKRTLPRWHSLLPAGLVLGAWFTFAMVQFESPIPASGLAKTAHDADVSGAFRLFAASFLRLIFPPIGMIAVPSALLALGALIAFSLIARKIVHKTGLVLMFSWLLLYMASYSVLSLPNFPWYYGPPAAVASLLLWIAIEQYSRITFVLPVVALVIVGANIVVPQPRMSLSMEPYWQAGIWLKTSANSDAVVAAYEIGIVGYSSDLKVVDVLGLTEPDARSYLARNDFGWAVRELEPDYVFIHEPDDWIVSDAIYGLPGFRSAYLEVARFKRPGSDVDYLLFERR